MSAYPQTWDDAQRRRFRRVSDMLGVDGLWERGLFIHVAGTNGKGSVCAFMLGMLRKAGYKVGMFISPHLYSPTERISIDGENISTAELDRLMAEAKEKAPGTTLFERYMYAALNYFEQNGTDINIIEAGIGGSLDCTSVIQPFMCVCTAIGLEHTALLGDTTAEIAAQKAGIAKPNVPFIIYPDMDANAHESIIAECERQQAMVFDLANGEISSRAVDGITHLTLSIDGLDLDDVPIGLMGGHQAKNAATAAYAAWMLNAFGLRVRPADIVFGLVSVNWPGRMQFIQGGGDTPDMLIDGAHTPQAAAALKQAVAQFYPGRDIVLLTAIMKDKLYKQVADELGGMAKQVVCTCADPERGLPAEQYAALFFGAKHDNNPQAALRKARELAGKDGLIVVCGSLYLPGLITEAY